MVIFVSTKLKRVKRERIDELTYIRGIAALGILIIHATGAFVVNSPFGSKAMYGGIFLNQFFRFGSPIFMMISGLVIFYNYRSREEFDAPRFFKKKIRFILLPYIIWTLVYFFYDVFYFDLEITTEMVRKLGKDIILGEGYSHLYFIFLIFQFYILVPIFLRFLPENMEKRPLRTVGISFLLQLLVMVYGYYFKLVRETGFIASFNSYYWKTVLAWHYYFILGGTIGVHYHRIMDFIEENIGKLALAFILVTVLYVGHPYLTVIREGSLNSYGKFGSARPHTMIYATVTMPVLMYIGKSMLGGYDLVRKFGTYSFGVYFSHPLVLNEIKRLLFRHTNIFGYGRISSLVLVCILGVILTYLFVAIIAMLPIRKLLIGNIPKFKFSLSRKEE